MKSLVGKVAEIGNIESLGDKPGLVIETSRESLMAVGRNMWGEHVIVSLVDMTPTVKDLIDALRELAAIGEGGIIERRETGKPTWHALDAVRDIARAAIAKAEGTQEHDAAKQEASAWREKAKTGEHPGKGFCLEEAERWESRAAIAKAEGVTI